MSTGENSISVRFEKSAAQHAGRIAIDAPAGCLTYAELGRGVNFLAAEILARRGTASEPVALLLDHDAPLIAAIFGTLKANKMYLALDPAHTAEQQTAMLVSSGAKLLLADAKNLAVASSIANRLCEIFLVPEIFPDNQPTVAFPKISGEADAWLMFTSGSTGVPKGVWQIHRGLVEEADAYAELIQLVPADRLALLAACGLAASGATLFAALLNGATLCLFQIRSQGIERLADWMTQKNISVFHSVPTVFRHLARAAETKNSFASVRIVRLGGEPVLRGDVAVFQRQFADGCRFIQSLSSTETGIICAIVFDRQSPLPAGRVPAGRPISGVEVFLVDEKNQPLKNGGEGKIAIRSARLRQGYWRQPELTAEKFLAEPQDFNRRVFISNDLGRFLPDGLLEHLGRVDQLVKVRGQRVDVSEVEAALLATGLVREAVVVTRENPAGEVFLVAYFVGAAGADLSPPNFRRQLKNQLLPYMIPNDFVALAKLPQTMAGKIDRRALPLPALRKTKLSRAESARDVIDRRLQRIWESTLNYSPIGRTDDFFQLGGSSLQSVEILLQIEELFGLSLPPSTLLEFSTIEKLSTLLADRAIRRSASPLIKLCDGGGRPLFLIHSGQGDLATYGLLTRRLSGRLVYGLQSVGLQGESWPLKNVPAMARRYLREILAQDPTGPYLLAGTCMGGMIAFELAQMLLQQGKKVQFLGLIETKLPLQPNEDLKGYRKIYVPVRTFIHERWRMLRWRVIRALGLGRNDRWLPSYRGFIVKLNGRAHHGYRPSFYPGNLTLFITSATTFHGADPRLMARSLAQSANVIAIAGDRKGLFMKPAVDELAEQLLACLNAVEKKN
jgi:amino acid adenylation domain-containing protein